MKRALCLAMLVACTCITPVAMGAAWHMEPSGRMWGQVYFPHSADYYTDLGAEVLAQVHSPRRLSFYLFIHLRSGAGYTPTPRGETGIDPNYQYYQQGLGLSYAAPVPLHLFLHRDCNHMLDTYDNRAEFWTALIFGIGTWPFYSSSPFLPPHGARRVMFLYFLGGGPVLKDTPIVIFDSNNPVTSESFGRALLVWPRWRHASLDLLVNSGMQTTWTDTKWHGHIATELGFTLHARGGGWRFYVGRRWRDTRWLRPIDRRNFWGISFLF